MAPRMAIIVNNSSGSENSPEFREELEEALREHGLTATIHLADSGEDIVALARGALEDGCERIVAGGGDGTVNAIASLVVGTGREMGILPLGTLNHFAKDLGIPLDLPSAVRILAEGGIADVDVGEVNGTIFINNSSIGLYPHMARHRKEQVERLGRNKWVALLWASLAVLGRYPSLGVKLVVDGKKITTRTPLVFIGNNDYKLQGFDIGRRERLDAGELSIYLPHRAGRMRLVWLAVRALFGHLRDAEDFDAIRAAEISIESRQPVLRVALDGEVKQMRTPLHYRICRSALKVVVAGERMKDGGGRMQNSK